MDSLSRAFGTYVVTASALLLASSCSLQARKGPPSLILDLRSFSQMNGVNSVTNGANVYGLDEFACLGINVTGPGIEDSDPYRDDKNPAADFAETLSGSPCAYRGIVSPPIYHGAASLSGELALKLPPGPVRIVQLLGIKNIASCQSGFIDPPGASGTDNDNYYELARAEVRDFFQDRSVALPMVDWSSLTPSEQAARSLDSCHDGNGGGATAPVVAISASMPAVVPSTNGVVELAGISISGAFTEYCALVNSSDPAGCTWSSEVLSGTVNVTMSDSHEMGMNIISFWARNSTGQVSNRADSGSFYYDSSTLAPTYSASDFIVAPGAAGKLLINLNRSPTSYAQYFCVKASPSPGGLTPGACTTPDWQLWVPSYQYTGTPGASLYVGVFVKDNHGNISPGGSVTGTATTVPGP